MPRAWLAPVGGALVEVAIPVGAAVAVGTAVAATVPPHWQTAGLPYFLGYGKNVELAAVGAGLAAGAASRGLARSRLGLRLAALVAAVGFGIVLARADLGSVLGAAPQLVAIALLVTAIGALGRGAPSSGPPRAARDPLPRALAAALLGGLAFAGFVSGIGALPVDVFHHGEVLASARDLLAGGRPFETFLWPHGLHDTGLTALWIRLTGKLGTSPVALARATCSGLGIVSVYLLGRAILGSRTEALAAAAVFVLLPSVLGDGRAAVTALYELGVLVFVALGFAVLVNPSGRHGGPSGLRELAAGACFGLAHLFRLETALFGLLAALGVLAWQGWEAAHADAGKAARQAAGSAARLLLGCVVLLAAARLLLGWPGSAWYAYTLGALPRYHTDAMGIPFPWPLPGSAEPPAAQATGLARLLLALLLAAQAVRLAVERGRGAARSRSGGAQLIFVALFAVLALRSPLSRSDPGHVLQWSAFPLVATVLLATAGLRDRLGWGPGRASLAAAALVCLLGFGSLGPRLPSLRGPAAIAAEEAARWRMLGEHLAPDPAVGACADRMFTPTEALASRRFIDDTCAVEGLLRAHRVSALVVMHAAPWYLVRFGMPLLSRYYDPARAYTPARQLELVEDLRRHRPGALLRARGYRAIESFDVPDALRIPVVDAYLRARCGDAAPIATPIGELYFWNEPAASPSPPGRSADAADPARIGFGVDGLAYQPEGELLVATGFAAELAARRPLAALELAKPACQDGAEGGCPGEVEYGFSRPGLAAGLGAEALVPSGWQLALHVAPGAWQTLRSGPGVVLRGTLASGGAVSLPIPLAGARVLGSLGPEWDGLGSAVARATALGRADRAAALAATARVARCCAALRP